MIPKMCPRECPDRCADPNCHSDCEHYAQFKGFREKINSEKAKDNLVSNYICGTVVKSRNPNKRKIYNLKALCAGR